MTPAMPAGRTEHRPPPHGEPVVAILLSTFNGAAFLPDQLASFCGLAKGVSWRLFWRDDGSTDSSTAIMRRFMARAGHGRCHEVLAPSRRVGATASFLFLLRHVVRLEETFDAIAFADQDDVWLPDKLQRAWSRLQALPAGQVAGYCTRQMLVDHALRPLGVSCAFPSRLSFPGALTQNLATGCTIVLNMAAARLVARTEAPARGWHDWWCYLVITASGGNMLVDQRATLLYRQHGGNAVGARATMLARAAGALRRGPGQFMAILSAQTERLLVYNDILTPEAKTSLDILRAGLKGRLRQKIRALRLQGLRRAGYMETLIFRLWYLIGAP
ncbi:glycosyltransferase [Acidocella sp.]|uniref:glycosyltransferase n=1 Tax=Acidocella sp. TaxID=50710 RepID=UPI003D01365D